MLTKRDLEQIATVVQVNIKEAFQDFYDNIFEPHVTQSAQDHREIVNAIRGLQSEMGEVKEYIKDHDERIERLEHQPIVKN